MPAQERNALANVSKPGDAAVSDVVFSPTLGATSGKGLFFVHQRSITDSHVWPAHERVPSQGRKVKQYLRHPEFLCNLT